MSCFVRLCVEDVMKTSNLAPTPSPQAAHVLSTYIYTVWQAFVFVCPVPAGLVYNITWRSGARGSFIGPL